jgi:hypothetical protein
MDSRRIHSFHIPVLGLAFSIDTPIRVARFGISSVVSLVDDALMEEMRRRYSSLNDEEYVAIATHEEDYRARRITAYLNLLHRIVQKQTAEMKRSSFEKGSEIEKYFEMLPDRSPLKILYRLMDQTTDAALRAALQDELRKNILPGAIDVNIMTKLDKSNKRKGAWLPPEYSDAIAALRGFVKSELDSSVVLSAGMNPRLFAYMGSCEGFHEDLWGRLRKKIILKVSDYRSAMIQGKVLARKGLWVSEFRIESGLNCGGHAFATDGTLMGPILEEFKARRESLVEELFAMYRATLLEKGSHPHARPHEVRITVQGGIGTPQEDHFLQSYFGVDGTGWGSPFLLVPDATNVDQETRRMLAEAEPKDFYLSDASPLGVPFNNLRGSPSEQQIRTRVAEGRPGSPCTKKYLVSNTEFTAHPICTASREYQRLKIMQLREQELSQAELQSKIDKLHEKACLCEGLAASVADGNHGNGTRGQHAVAVCPGPNLAFFSRVVSLEEMVGHIYGRVQGLVAHSRPNMFVNELRLNIDYLKAEISKRVESLSTADWRHFEKVRMNLHSGIEYYRALIPRMVEETERYRELMQQEIAALEEELMVIAVPCPVA